MGLSEEDAAISMHREAIRDLVARYNSYGDGGKFDPLFDLFLPDAVMEIQSPERGVTRYEGLEQVKTIFTGTKDRLQDDSGARTYMRHFTATHQIDLVDDAHATGRLYFAVLMPHGLDHWGRYIDQYALADDRWRFAERRVQVDGRVESSPFGASA